LILLRRFLCQPNNRFDSLDGQSASAAALATVGFSVGSFLRLKLLNLQSADPTDADVAADAAQKPLLKRPNGDHLTSRKSEQSRFFVSKHECYGNHTLCLHVLTISTCH
jgi:hypothetical protein